MTSFANPPTLAKIEAGPSPGELSDVASKDKSGTNSILSSQLDDEELNR